MNFVKVIGEVASQLDKAGIRYALIGGFAMALRGVQRVTIDLDFILMLEDWKKADQISNPPNTSVPSKTTMFRTTWPKTTNLAESIFYMPSAAPHSEC